MGELGGIVPLFFDGAVCDWAELPRHDNTTEMGKVYAYLRALEQPSKSFFMHRVINFIKKLKRKK